MLLCGLTSGTSRRNTLSLKEGKTKLIVGTGGKSHEELTSHHEAPQSDQGSRPPKSYHGLIQGISKGLPVTIHITTPEIDELIDQRLRSGKFKDAEDVILQALRSSAPRTATTQPDAPAGRTVFEQGLGLFSSPEDAALLDELVSIAYEERHWPTKTLAL